MKCPGHVAGSAGKRINTGLWCGNLKERDHLEDLTTDGRILKGSQGNQMGRWEDIDWTD
jgi:hypothetical protein